MQRLADDLGGIDQHGAGNGHSFDVEPMPHAERMSQHNWSSSRTAMHRSSLTRSLVSLTRECHEPLYQCCCLIGRPRSHPDGWEQRAIRGSPCFDKF